VFPSPKSQPQEVGVFVEMSENTIVSGAAPDEADCENDATGTRVPTVAVTTPVWVTELLPAALVTVRLTVYVPAVE